MTETPERIGIVTGGGSGIGLAISERLAADGNAVAIFDRDGASAVAGADGINGSGTTAIAVAVDVTDRPSIDAGVAEVHERLGRPTIVVTGAGKNAVGRFLSITSEQWNDSGGQPQRHIRPLPGRRCRTCLKRAGAHSEHLVPRARIVASRPETPRTSRIW